MLPVGVLGVRGEFGPGDAVTLVAPDGREIGRGLARMGASEAAAIAGKKGEDLAALRGSDEDSSWSTATTWCSPTTKATLSLGATCRSTRPRTARHVRESAR